MNLTTEQIQAILDGAPDGATHYQSTTYLRYDSKSWVWWNEEESGWCFVRDDSIGWAQFLGGHHGSISDLREILTLRLEVERLNKVVKLYKNFTGAAVDYCSALEGHLLQLREQGDE